jgi:hypothetical protein
MSIFSKQALQWFVMTVALLLPGVNCMATGANMRIFPAPKGEPLSSDFTVTADGKNVPVYLATVATADPARRVKIFVPHDTSYADHTSFATFDAAGDVTVTVTCPQPIQSAKISPVASGITPVISGNQLTFTISKPRQLALEINGDWVHALQVFANPLESDVPRPDDPNVIYYGPGIHKVDGVQVTSGKTVYVAGGAVVYGEIQPGRHAGFTFILTGNNIVFRGRGIIDGSLCPSHSRSLIGIRGTNVVLEDVILRDSSGWTVPIRSSERVSVKNIKLFGVRANSDGIDICNSRHVNVSDCYLRTMDDLVVVKTPVKNGGESADIDVDGCVLWNELAHALSIGAELRDNVERVRFADCDIIHDKGREWLLRVYHCDAADIHNVTFENIRIEEARRLMSLWIGHAIWSKDADRGHIEDVTFHNIRAAGPDPQVELKGFDATHEIKDVHFENIVINGHPLKSSEVKENEFVHSVSVQP